MLSRRPEVAEVARLAHPGWADLAAVLLRPRELALTLTRLDRFVGQVLELASIEGGRLTAEVAREEGLERAHLDTAARELRRWGLAATDHEGALVVPPVVTSAVWDPGGLGTPAARLVGNLPVEDLRSMAMLHGLSGAMLPKRKGELAEAVRARLTDREAIRALLGSAPPAARAELEALRKAGGTSRGGRAGSAWEYPYSSWSTGWASRNDRGGVGWLVARGIALPEDERRTSVAVPAEVERALRSRVFGRWDVSAPAPGLAPMREERHPVDLIIAMDTLLETWRHAPPPALKDGGVPKREIKRAAQRLGQSEDEAEQLVALAWAARLLGERELVAEKRSRSWRRPRVLQSRRAVVEPSGDAQRWLGLPEAERWLELARAWLGSTDAMGGRRSAGPSRERLVLELLGEIAEGHGASPTSIGAALSWRHPALFSDAASAAALASTLGRGIASLGAGSGAPAIGLNAVGRLAFLSGGAVDVEVLRRAFPPPADRCVVTADHRVVVSGPPHGELAGLLRRIAEVVSVRPARVYRISAASLGRALDGGLTAPAMLEALRRHVSEPIPANVVTLVEDVARRHGRLRVGTAHVYVVADDPAQLELVARERAVGGNRLRRLSPTVAVIEGRDRDEVMAALRRAGLMPVADGAGPTAATETAPAPPPRASRPARERPSMAEPAALDDARAAGLVAALRAAPARSERAVATAPSREEAVRATLAEAARSRRPVEIGYRGASGALEIHTVAPYGLRSDQVYVQDTRRFSVYALDPRRILWAESLDARSGPMERNGPQRTPDPASPRSIDEIDLALDGDDLLDDDDLDGGDAALLRELDRFDEAMTRGSARRRR